MTKTDEGFGMGWVAVAYWGVTATLPAFPFALTDDITEGDKHGKPRLILVSTFANLSLDDCSNPNTGL